MQNDSENLTKSVIMHMLAIHRMCKKSAHVSENW